MAGGRTQPGRTLLRPPTEWAGPADPVRVKFVATIGDHVETVEVTGTAGRYRLTIGSEVREVDARLTGPRSEEHTSELQSRPHLVCRLLLEQKNAQDQATDTCVI